MDFIKSNKKWIGIGACIVALLGTFFNFVTAKVLFMSKSVTYFSTNDGKIAVVAIIVSAVLIYLKKEKVSLITLVGSLGLTIYDGIDGIQKLKEAASVYGTASLSIGFYIIVIGLAIAIAIQFIKSDKTSNKKQEVSSNQ